jgi:hypothetical protein
MLPTMCAVTGDIQLLQESRVQLLCWHVDFMAGMFYF